VGPGDSLGSLALRYYGDAAHYLTLFTANRALLATPDGLRVGQSIIIPDLSQP
jgi:nucleoid-associated protein YgaU